MSEKVVTNEELFGLMMSAVKDHAVFMIDPSGVIATWNEGAYRLSGYEEGEVLGKHFSLLYTPEDNESKKSQKHLEMAAKAGRLEISGWRVRRDGSRFWASSVITALHDKRGELIGFSKVCRDLTEKVQELIQARDRAVEASTLKSVFVANISHELRTPLSGIIGLTELLLPTELSQEQLELSKGIDESAKMLMRLVNDLLDFSKIEAGKLSIECVPIHLSLLIQDATRGLADSARIKNLSLGTYIDQLIPQFLLGDPARIRQVLMNLLANAIRFTDSGRVFVNAILHSTENDRVTVRFSVLDTGIGISQEDQSRLFNAFSQLDQHQQHFGAGLGLSISKKLVQLMGGEIGVRSKAGEGSEFWFTIPFSQPLALPGNNPENSQPSRWVTRIPPGKVALVVEDNTTLLSLAMKQLARLGMRAVAAESGEEALKVMQSNTPIDVILMDCNLPELTGFDVTSKIREMEQGTGKHVPIIAMTALAMKGDRERCLTAGMDDYLCKPVYMEDLAVKLEEWLVDDPVREVRY